MPVELPDEILLEISKLLSEESTLDLKPLTLLNRQWHNVVAPVLLSTVSVSSIHKILGLCDHVLSFTTRTGGTLRSTIETHTKTIVIDGKTLDPAVGDCYAGLEDPEYTLQEPSIYQDTTAQHEDILTAVNDAIPRLVALEGLEWYGRFAGDYYLTQRLLKTGKIKHLTYGVEMVSSESPGYRENAFLFEGLKTITVSYDYESDPEVFSPALKMMHRNPDIEKLIFDCKGMEELQGRSLMDLIQYRPHPGKSIFVWPKLKHLVFRFFKDELWYSAHQVGCFTQFLVAHPTIETLVLSDMSVWDYRSETVSLLSLSPYPDSLPRLKVLLGSPWLIAGVLESTAACSSVVSIIDSFQEGPDDEFKAPYVDRIVAALEKVPTNQVQRLRLELPQLSREVYAKFARAAPQIRFLEFLRFPEGENTTPRDENFDPFTDIPSRLLGFPKIDTIGVDIVTDFIDSANNTPNQSLFLLAKQVPGVTYVHCRKGLMLEVVRDSDGNPRRLKEAAFLDNSEYDLRSSEMTWRHRPLSRRAERKTRESETRLGVDELFEYERCSPEL